MYLRTIEFIKKQNITIVNTLTTIYLNSLSVIFSFYSFIYSKILSNQVDFLNNTNINKSNNKTVALKKQTFYLLSQYRNMIIILKNL